MPSWFCSCSKTHEYLSNISHPTEIVMKYLTDAHLYVQDSDVAEKAQKL